MRYRSPWLRIVEPLIGLAKGAWSAGFGRIANEREESAWEASHDTIGPRTSHVRSIVKIVSPVGSVFTSRSLHERVAPSDPESVHIGRRQCRSIAADADDREVVEGVAALRVLGDGFEEGIAGGGRAWGGFR